MVTKRTLWERLRSHGRIKWVPVWRDVLGKAITGQDLIQAARNFKKLPVVIVTRKRMNVPNPVRAIINEALTVVGSIQPMVIEDTPVLVITPTYERMARQCIRCGKTLSTTMKGDFCSLCRSVDELRARRRQIYYLLDTKGNSIGWWCWGRETPKVFLKRCETSGLPVSPGFRSDFTAKRVRNSAIFPRLGEVREEGKKTSPITLLAWEKA